MNTQNPSFCHSCLLQIKPCMQGTCHFRLYKCSDFQMKSKCFGHGNFMAKLSQGQFNSVWMDYCLETTENKSLKSNGGIIGLTHCDAALGRWFLSRPVTAKYSHMFGTKDKSPSSSSKNCHHTDTPALQRPTMTTFRRWFRCLTRHLLIHFQ